ncbi:MAG TPA: hypothetical protein VMI54_00670 [Polyangiaceae bacterium]|nr:hypothetical protein [Polyangiaceae bacterium]
MARRVATAKSAPPAETCEYSVSAPRVAPFVVHVRARCEGGGVTGFAATEPRIVPFVTSDGAPASSAVHPATRVGPGVAELTYSVDLDGLARRENEIDYARRFGRALLAPASSFLLRPDPERDDVPIRVRFATDGIESGLARDKDGFVLASQEIRVGTYTTFGPVTTRDLVVAGASVRLAILDGALDLAPDVYAKWVADAERGVIDFFERPPAPRTLVVLAPIPALHGVLFGKMLPASGPGVVVILGEHTTPPELTDDWILVHELFHAGTPSFVDEGKWYDEGLATYFEPLIRARLGWYPEKQLWREFLRNMPRGLDAMTRGLEHPVEFSDTYWGGGLFCLLADVEERRATDGARGLEDGLRAVLRSGGDATQVWPLAQALDVADRALGAPVLAPLAAAHANRGAPVDLAGLFQKLGVALDARGDATLDDGAPLARIRHALVYGAPSGADLNQR